MDLSIHQAAQHPTVAARIALVAHGVETTYAELGRRAARIRSALAEQGVRAGSRVALVARNEVDGVAVIHALLDLGATLVPIHPKLTSAERAVILADAAPHLTIEETTLGDLGHPGDAPTPEHHDPALPLAMIFTSGTTGRPKGAVLARRAFLASARGSEQNLGWREHDRWVLCMPICHVGGLSILTRCLLAGTTVVLEPRFDPDAVLAAIVRERATLLSVVPTMLTTLLERDSGGALSGLRAVLVGGAATPFALLEECARRGVGALATYGLTEACSQVTVQRLQEPYRATRGSGHPLPGVEVRIAREGGEGRIQVRGPTLMDGYFAGPDRPPVPARDAEGWLDTGDLGELDDDGVLHVHARRSDLIVTGGENVYPIEVEQILEAMPGVRRALVFGVPDERWGQVVAVALELDGAARLDDLPPAIARALASHKRPRLACVVEGLPLTSSGKLLRAGAHARYAASLRPLR